MSLFTERLESGLRDRGAVDCGRFPAYQLRIEHTPLGPMLCSVHEDRLAVWMIDGNRTLTLPYYMPSVVDADDALSKLDRLLNLSTSAVVD